MFRQQSHTGENHVNSILFLSKLGALTFVAMASVYQHSTVNAASPNIVLILVDDMGYGDPGCFNPNSRIPTPNIDGLAASGMKFTDAHASGPLCHLSRYGLMTGRYPFRTNVGKWRSQPAIEPSRMTVASFLKSAGYRTAMVGKWHLGFEENGYDNPLPGGPVDRGFDSFFGIRASTDIPPYFYIRGNKAVQPPTGQIEDHFSEGWTRIQGEFWRAGGIAPNLNLRDVLPRFTDEAVAQIESHAKSDDGKPLMLYLAYPAPHTPWLPAVEFVGQSGAGMYGDFAMMVDHNVGRVLEALHSANISDDTLVIFTSDNGPVWYENDVERFGHDSSGGLRGMKSDAWECGHRMPFIVRWPKHVQRGTTSNEVISFVDVFATLADVVDKSLPAESAPDSFSFYDVLKGKQPSHKAVRDHLVLKSGGGLRTIRSGTWKLIAGLGSGGFSEPRRVKSQNGGPAGQLYNLKSDPGETRNVYLEHPQIVQRLTKTLQDIESASGQRFMEYESRLR